ncbi:hypothetical protein [Gilliamella sp. ESL0250]|uniref:hypothetical protein n=1 Tax=Gilliamella sp. ESL0250 TaxID=2705036 RepID=UPI001580CF2E|nr:hypothetical protein [Gilliamella sp. ESL0250]NUF49948.1 hypothetical protein [Gilliamella sp. ESL0250]
MGEIVYTLWDINYRRDYSRYLHPKLVTTRYPSLTIAKLAAKLLKLAKEENIPPNLMNVYIPILTKRYSVNRIN